MRSHSQPSSLRRFFQSRWFLIGLLFFTIFVAVSYARAYYQDYKIRQEIRELQDEIKTLERKKIESLEILQYVTSDTFVEEKARTELNLKKPGEHVILLEDDAEAPTYEEPVPEAFPLHTLSNPKKWWYYFIHRTLSFT